MRKPFIAGNWKMNATAREATELIKQLLPGLAAFPQVEQVICPPFTALSTAAGLLAGTTIGLGAQDLFWEASGAFTGAVSAGMIGEFCKYVIIGHSERRMYFGETDETVNKKVKTALANGLIPIVCVGETLEQNQSGKTASVIIRQVRDGLTGLSPEQAVKLVVAYEPVWAIGTGLPATGEGANHVAADMIRPMLKNLFGNDIAQGIRVLYGGSAKASNVAEFFQQADIDGALVGGASLKADEFIKIVQAAVQ